MLDNLKQFKISKESLVTVLGGKGKCNNNDRRKCKGKHGNDKKKCEEKWYGNSGINSTGGSDGNTGGD